MIGASKILTVSYGTFSCTLEGFDDPFNTMRAIAEYFRDLAAEDRYFGAEPPTPDAAMLHRIAEREVQRRVEAKVQENGIVLRASDAEAPAAQPAPAVVPAVAPAAPTVAPAAALAATAPAPAAPAEPVAESIAARLLRLRSEVAAQQGSAPPVPGPASTETVAADPAYYVEDEAQPAALADFLPEQDGGALDGADADWAEPARPAASWTAFEESAQEQSAQTRPEQDDTAGAAPEQPDTALAATTLPPAEPFAAPAALSLVTRAEPLQPAEAEASAQAAAIADIVDAEPMPAPVPEMAEDALDLPEGLLDRLAGPAAAPEAPAPAPAATGDDSLHASLATLFAEPEADEPETAFDAKAESLFAPAEADPLDAIAQADAFDDTDTDSGALAAHAVTPELRPGAAEKLQRARARVIRIKRSDAPAPEAPPAALSPEDEAALERELAALRGDEDDSAQRPAANPFGDDPSAEDAVTRLMAQADTEMKGEETKRRQSAIAHLKAAVAQTVAERRAGEVKTDPEPSRIARYRNDLAMVVRSALPGGGTAPPKPQANRPAPLVLVSEQRIDKPRPTPPAATPGPATATPAAAPAVNAVSTGQPIRPRRVTSSGPGLAMQQSPDPEDEADDFDFDMVEALNDAAEPVAPAAEDQAFRDYVARLGATSMREMIEAAAAFLVCEQGRPGFTRPQLMRRVHLIVPQSDHHREDGLRVFGTLLRDGQIAKVRRGQFTLTAQSAYFDRA